MSLTYVWKINGAVMRTFTSATALTDAFTLSGASDADQIIVAVTPNDGFGDGLTVSDTATIDVWPAVTIDQAASQADPTNSSPINFTVVFSKAVDDFATGNVTLSGSAGDNDCDRDRPQR